jgi:hypothetical protein
MFEETTFGADSSASLGSYLDVRYNSVTAQLDKEALPDQHVVQRRTTENPAVISTKKMGKMQLSTYLAPTGTPIDDAVVTGALTDPVFAGGQLLRSAMGGYRSHDGSTEDGGTSTVSQLDVVLGDGVNWNQASAVGVHVANTTNIEAREVISVTTDAIVPDWKFSAVPQTSSTVYNAHTFYITEDPTDSLAFLLETRDRENLWWVFASQGGFGITLPMHQFPTIDYDLQLAQWFHDNDVATPAGGGTFDESTYTDGPPVPFVQSEVRFDDFVAAGDQTLTTMCPSALTVNFDYRVSPVTCPGGVNGVSRYRHLRSTPFVTGNLVTFFDSDIAQDDTLWDDWEGSVLQRMAIQIGNLPGGTVLIALPRVQITNVQRVPSEDKHGISIDWKALDDTSNAASGDQEQSPVRFHKM